MRVAFIGLEVRITGYTLGIFKGLLYLTSYKWSKWVSLGRKVGVYEVVGGPGLRKCLSPASFPKSRLDNVLVTRCSTVRRFDPDMFGLRPCWIYSRQGAVFDL